MSKEISKFLSYVLRHNPESIGIKLDSQGWVEIEHLIAKAIATGKNLDTAVLNTVVMENDKRRFTISNDGKRIRAAQGHSVKVDLGKEAVEPPEFLYHGTATRFVESILVEGLLPQGRQQVHLSLDLETALKVGQRHGKPYLFRVAAAAMFSDGFQFFVADNGVWLTDAVPAKYLSATSKSAPERES